MTQLICGADGTRMECEENGVLYVDGEQGNFAKCDIYKCPKCGATVASGFGDWLLPDTGKRMLARYQSEGYGLLFKGHGYSQDREGAV